MRPSAPVFNVDTSTFVPSLEILPKPVWSPSCRGAPPESGATQTAWPPIWPNVTTRPSRETSLACAAPSETAKRALLPSASARQTRTFPSLSYRSKMNPPSKQRGRRASTAGSVSAFGAAPAASSDQTCSVPSRLEQNSTEPSGQTDTLNGELSGWR